eukprot:gnl/TRDRNA2_/TRDRNA2_158274_c0_seq2.p1 gnl/TRDRNA2_/TRDRNA2_158274_c0~~gnl/TRDRNA2_/TRDRNA2_158274_c0_seq2.p1  ORF type:complete len:484 (+),score=95.53 gnl/TRDRNA2_/TRDRNA2_158274_c0_seq2:120-1454(+)
MGADAKLIGCLDITWASAAATEPTIAYTEYSASDFLPDPAVLAVVRQHQEKLKELDRAMLCWTPSYGLKAHGYKHSAAGKQLTSVGVRLGQKTMGTLLTGIVRKAMGAHCVCINAGNIRGNRDYPDDREFLSYSDLKAEVPFDAELVVLPLPGKVIQEMVQYSRQWAYKSPPEEKGCFMQCDDGIIFDESTQTVTHIAGKLVIPDKIYDCVVLWRVAFNNIDNVVPLFEHCKMFGNPEDEDFVESDFAQFRGVTCSFEAALPAKQIIVEFCANQVWTKVLKAGGVKAIDSDSSGFIDREELKKAVAMVYGDSIGNLAVDNMMISGNAEGGRLALEDVLMLCIRGHLKSLEPHLWTSEQRSGGAGGCTRYVSGYGAYYNESDFLATCSAASPGAADQFGDKLRAIFARAVEETKIANRGDVLPGEADMQGLLRALESHGADRVKI